ncbi:MAG: hypothetical protein WB439_11865 [Acidobacteriaceae bacterium]
MSDRDCEDDEMLPEYDFSKGVRNPYAQRFQELNLVSLDPDVEAVFPNSEAVNEALRLLINVARASAAAKTARLSADR